jgi:hypothetical protein
VEGNGKEGGVNVGLKGRVNEQMSSNAPSNRRRAIAASRYGQRGALMNGVTLG